MDLERALEHALAGDAILFVGAGFSRQTTTVRGTPMKSGSDFARHLAILAGLPQDLPLDEAAEEFLRSRGRDELLAELKGEFTVPEADEHHRVIASVPWRRIYTTNYDNVIEAATAAVGSSIHSVTLTTDIRSIPKSERIVVHLNGFVERLSRSNITSEVKLTDTSYLTATIANSDWAVMFRQDLAIAQAVFFVGYSLYDLDIRRILFEDPALRGKSFYFIGSNPDGTTARRIPRFGKALHQSVVELANSIYRKQSSYQPPEHTTPVLHCFKVYKPRKSNITVLDRHLFELFLYGVVREDLVRTSVESDVLYFRERHYGRTAVDKLSKGQPVVVHSRLGNGKSLVLEGIKYRLFRRGYHVYTAHVRTERVLTELDQLLSSPDRIAIVVDNYPDWLDVLEAIGRNGRTVALALAARSPTHDVLFDRISEMFESSIIEIPADQLSGPNLEWVHRVFDTHGLWGDRAAFSRSRKQAYLKQNCGAEFHAILLDLFESPDILRRFEAILEPILAKGEHHRAIVIALVLSLIGHPPTLEMLADLSDESVLEAGFRRNPVIQQLIDFERGRVRLRSSVAAQFILKRISDPNITVDVLISLARAADRAARANSTYRELFRTLMRYSTLQEVLPKDPAGAAVGRYYENVKNLEGARRNPLFWLQYGIAALSIDELARAQKYFESAYAYAEQLPNYNTYQIDNHYARLLLMRASREGTTIERMNAFRRARRIVNEQIAKERLFYPYRVAKLYRDFFESSEGDLSLSEIDEIRKAAAYVLRRIDELPKERQQQRYVRDCRKSLELIAPT